MCTSPSVHHIPSACLIMREDCVAVASVTDPVRAFAPGLNSHLPTAGGCSLPRIESWVLLSRLTTDFFHFDLGKIFAILEQTPMSITWPPASDKLHAGMA
ncbi:hypothetical protein V2G26_001128 [Clonostachys chloroleuca]